MVVRTKLRHLVAAVHHLYSPHGVTTTEIKKYLRQNYWYPNDMDYKRTIKTAVSEGLFEVKNHRIYPYISNNTIVPNGEHGRSNALDLVPIPDCKGNIQKHDFRILLQKKAHDGRTRSFAIGWEQWKQDRAGSFKDDFFVARRRKRRGMSRRRSRRSRIRRGKRRTAEVEYMITARRGRGRRRRSRRRRSGGRRSRGRSRSVAEEIGPADSNSNQQSDKTEDPSLQ